MKKFFIYLILIVLLFPIFIYPNSFASYIVENSTVTFQTNANIRNLEILSDAVIMVEKDTGDILYTKNAYEKMYPASTTKILSAILILEHCSLDDIVTVNSSALKAVPATYSVARLKAR